METCKGRSSRCNSSGDRLAQAVGGGLGGDLSLADGHLDVEVARVLVVALHIDVALDDVAGLHGDRLSEVLKKGIDAQNNEKGQKDMSGLRWGTESSADCAPRRR